MSLLYKDILKIAEQRFTDENCLTPRLDAELLLGHMLNRDRSFFFTHYGDTLDEDACERYFELVDRRASGIPVQYITGTQEFMGLPFSVNPDVLIPRQDTETLVECVLEALKTRKGGLSGLQVLDLCTGSGAIAISLAHHLKETKLKVTASDLSAAALQVAKGNAEKNKVTGLLRFVESDLFEAFPKKKSGEGKTRYDLIVSNPPYIPTGVLPTLMREVKDHEPLLALDGGKDGIDFYLRILGEAPAYLKKDGLLILEIGHDQGDIITALAEASGFYGPVSLTKDPVGNNRVARMQVLSAPKKKFGKRPDNSEKVLAK